MELSDTIKEIIKEFGKEIIAQKRFIFMMSDYYSFRDNPADKRVIAALVDGGYTARILKAIIDGNVPIVINQIVADLCKNYGFREELVINILNILSSSVGVETSIETINYITTEGQSSNIRQLISEGPYFSEEYIMSLYPQLFENVPFHAHMDFDVFLNKLKLDSDEAFQLFRFLKGMGVYILNNYSYDYDMYVDSEVKLKKLYRNYISQQRVVKIPLHGGFLIKREHLLAIIKKLYKKRFISVDDIISELSSCEQSKKISEELFGLLRTKKVINSGGRCLNPYLTPESMVNNFISIVMDPFFN